MNNAIAAAAAAAAATSTTMAGDEFPAVFPVIEGGQPQEYEDTLYDVGDDYFFLNGWGMNGQDVILGMVFSLFLLMSGVCLAYQQSIRARHRRDDDAVQRRTRVVRAPPHDGEDPRSAAAELQRKQIVTMIHQYATTYTETTATSSRTSTARIPIGNDEDHEAGAINTAARIRGGTRTLLPTMTRTRTDDTEDDGVDGSIEDVPVDIEAAAVLGAIDAEMEDASQSIDCEQQPWCAICLDSFQPEDSILVCSNSERRHTTTTHNHCPHVYHEQCAVEYVLSTQHQEELIMTAPCPCCRKPLLPPPLRPVSNSTSSTSLNK